MIQEIKTELCSLIRGLGYNITDNGAYVENFPWLMLRTGRHNHNRSRDTRTEDIVLIIDIFSKYKGEKEILEITENITNHIWELKETIPGLVYVNQRDLKIIDDKATGPVKKHGIVYYSFLISLPIGEEENGNDTTGD